MITLAAFALETANWYSQAAELQRVADSAAMAGAIEYIKDNGCDARTTPCYTAGTDYAVMNGVAATNVAMSLGASPTDDGNTAIQATLTKSIPLMLSQILSDDIKALYGEVAQAEGPAPSAHQIDAWFWQQTVAGRLLIALRTAAMASDNKALKTVGGRFFVPAYWLP